ncbi:aminopeptidase [bacterium]|nr:aminopeptidase [bacterium]
MNDDNGQSGMRAAVGVICRDCMGLRPGETLLLVADPFGLETAEVILRHAQAGGYGCRLAPIPLVERAGQAPEGFGRELLASAEAALLLTWRSLSHTEARRQACREDGVRIASLPGFRLEMLARLFPPGSAETVAAATRQAAALLDGADRVRVQAEAGTDITFSLAGRHIYLDTGLYREPGRFGNLPAGEVAAAPVDRSAGGVLVVDVAFAGLGEVDRLRLYLEGGCLRAAEGPGADEVMKLLHGPAERVSAEFGIGVNRLARTGALTLEAEKACGTVHFAFGDSHSFGGANAAAGHWDAVLRCASIEVDGRRVELPRPVTWQPGEIALNSDSQGTQP